MSFLLVMLLARHLSRGCPYVSGFKQFARQTGKADDAGERADLYCIMVGDGYGDGGVSGAELHHHVAARLSCVDKPMRFEDGARLAA